MLSRREFVTVTAAGTATLLASRLLAQTPAPAQAPAEGALLPTRGKLTDKPLPTNHPVGGKVLLPHHVGIGSVAIGNGFAPISDEQAQQTLQAAWDAGLRFFDTSPFYGAGLAEHRVGRFLHNHKPDEYFVSTKVGRIYKATTQPLPEPLWKSPSPFTFTYDYTADGVLRSIEDSLQRLGVSRLDFAFIHDLSPDNPDFGPNWTQQFDIAVKGAIPALTKLREQGVIKGWGFGVNRPEPILRAIEVADPNIFVMATQYSLLEHREPLEKTLPALAARKISVIVGAPLLAGFLVGRDRYLYGGTIPPGAKEKRQKLQAVADQFGIDLRTASLQFAAAHPAVTAVIPGARTPEQVRANVESFRVAIPGDFWRALKDQDLIANDAPVPA